MHVQRREGGGCEVALAFGGAKGAFEHPLAKGAF
eukprot:CAMPEP_0119351442 /NCGR_PEP_ID=MMETSP1334-20130426/717_1 /TAXON_ID=127549 /ORGANISM="Calcidiscus leptoporus, Strain RCC1130" /LENGTH=33 /DNA_ID= /DNA_START= /DNA_END= /DNA_ORIENTATION=